MGTWINRARGAATYIAQDTVDTVTVFLGAGASISSGAPGTRTIEQALLAADLETFGGDIEEVSKKLHTVPREVVKNTIKPLFKDVEPHLGYLSLAALSRRVRVLIVNLNWDSAVEAACEQVGLAEEDYTSLTLEDGVEEITERLSNTRYKLVNLHLHGRLDHSEKIKFGRRDTLSFDSSEEELVWSEFLSNPTIVVGASLSGEYDITKLLDNASESASAGNAPFWLFSRQAERTQAPEDRDVRNLLARHESEANFAGDPYVDFDRLMIELLEASAEKPLSAVFEGTHQAEPRRERLVLPDPDLVRGRLDGPSPKRILSWIGERRVGKTTSARIVAHWASLRSETLGEVKTPTGKLDCARDAAKLVDEGTARPEDFVIFEDPFGPPCRYEDNDRFMGALEQILEMDPQPRVMITCCPSNWRRAKHDYPLLADCADEIFQNPTKWYRGVDLAANADDQDSLYPAMVTRRVIEGVASTPARVAAANELRSAAEDEEVIAEKLTLLGEVPREEQEFLAVVRFYELSSSVAPQKELIERCFNRAKAADPAGDTRHMIEEFELDGDSFWRFAHYTDRAAFDRLYEKKGEVLLAEVLKHVYGEDVTDSVCAGWQAIANARSGDFSLVEGLSLEQKLEWGPVLLEEVANSGGPRHLVADLLTLLPKVAEHDFWSLRELVYEVVRLWPELHESQAAIDFIDEVLGDHDRMGRYCVIESLLYFQDTTHSETWQRDERLMELWEKATAARWAIVKDVEAFGTELSLIIDAFAWYRPPLPRDQLIRWLKPLIRAAEAVPRLKGAFALTVLYHPPGADLFLEVGKGSPLDYLSHLDEEQVEQAAAMVRWHYIHQSRARALLPRRRLEPTNPDYLRRTEQPKFLPDDRFEQARELIEQMAGWASHAGWAAHLGMNLYWTAGKFDASFLARCVQVVEAEDEGLITAAATYAIPSGVLEAMKKYFDLGPNRQALLSRLREGCKILSAEKELTVTVKPPRFNAGRNPYGLHRQLGTRWRGSLERLGENPSTDPEFASRVHAILRGAYEEGILELDAAIECERWVRAGDYEALELLAHSPGKLNKKLQGWLDKQDGLTELVVLTARDLVSGP